DEVDERRPGEVGGARGRAVLGQVVAGRVEAELVVGEPHGPGPAHLRLADDHLEVDAGPVDGRLPGLRDDLEGDPRMPLPQLRHGGRGDEGAEPVGRRQADGAGELAAAGVEGGEGGGDPLPGGGGALAEGREAPTVGGAHEYPAAEGALERLDAPGD